MENIIEQGNQTQTVSQRFEAEIDEFDRYVYSQLPGKMGERRVNMLRLDGHRRAIIGCNITVAAMELVDRIVERLEAEAGQKLTSV